MGIVLISDISKRILIYDDYNQAKATEYKYLLDGKVQGVQNSESKNRGLM